MNEKRAIAGAILDISKKVVTTERGQQHGDAEASFVAIGEMWVAYLNAVSVRRTGLPLTSLRLTAADVAFMMVQMKQMRVLYGDETDPDNYVDAAGYTALAGMFAVPARRVAPGVSAAAVTPEQPPMSPIPPFLTVRNTDDGVGGETPNPDRDF